MRKWFTAQELAGLPGMPGTAQGCRLMAIRKGWQSRRRTGSKAREYPLHVLPAETQQALGKPVVSHAAALPADELVALRAILDLALAEGWDVARFKRVASKLLAEGGRHA